MKLSVFCLHGIVARVFSWHRGQFLCVNEHFMVARDHFMGARELFLVKRDFFSGMECFFGGVSPGCQGLGCGQGQGAQVYVELEDLSDRLGCHDHIN